VVLSTLPGSSQDKGTDPPTTQTPCLAATAARKSCNGPLPSDSRTATLSVSFIPRMPKYSGSTTSLAPSMADCAIKAAAVAIFSATRGVDTICKAATLKGARGMAEAGSGVMG